MDAYVQTVDVHPPLPFQVEVLSFLLPRMLSMLPSSLGEMLEEGPLVHPGPAARLAYT